jgi:peptide chain release factor 1
MIPPEASDSRNTVMEIRAGTGGEEAALVRGRAGPAATRGTPTARAGRFEPMNSSYSERGGLRDVRFLISGHGRLQAA